MKLLQNCKTWGGPCTSVVDLENALVLADDAGFCVTQKITCYKLTHPTESSINQICFDVRNVTHEEKLSHLRFNLSNEEVCENNRRVSGNMPTNYKSIKVSIPDLH